MTRPTSPQDDRGAPEAPGTVSGGLWLSRQDVAALLRCHVNHVDRLRAEGMPARYFGRLVRFHRPTLEAWLLAGIVSAGGVSDVSGTTGLPDGDVLPAEVGRTVDRKPAGRARRRAA